MKTVEQILKTKSQHQTVYTIGPDDSVLDALKMLAEKNIGALPVVEGKQVVGIVSARLCTQAGAQGRLLPPPGTGNHECTSGHGRAQENLEYCMNLMTDRHLRHLPVEPLRASQPDQAAGAIHPRRISAFSDSRAPVRPVGGQNCAGARPGVDQHFEVAIEHSGIAMPALRGFAQVQLVALAGHGLGHAGQVAGVGQPMMMVVVDLAVEHPALALQRIKALLQRDRQQRAPLYHFALVQVQLLPGDPGQRHHGDSHGDGGGGVEELHRLVQLMRLPDAVEVAGRQNARMETEPQKPDT
uniref:CBS domain-containing protein n=1 Tax=Ditylenchus dipsaci TaxID=166011 RepID=A0A915DU91_9BILA